MTTNKQLHIHVTQDLVPSPTGITKSWYVNTSFIHSWNVLHSCKLYIYESFLHRHKVCTLHVHKFILDVLGISPGGSSNFLGIISPNSSVRKLPCLIPNTCEDYHDSFLIHVMTSRTYSIMNYQYSFSVHIMKISIHVMNYQDVFPIHVMNYQDWYPIPVMNYQESYPIPVMNYQNSYPILTTSQYIVHILWIQNREVYVYQLMFFLLFSLL